jgi:hypothetical protein
MCRVNTPFEKNKSICFEIILKYFHAANNIRLNKINSSRENKNAEK